MRRNVRYKTFTLSKRDIDVLRNGEKVCSIRRILKMEQIGNFNPIFVRYRYEDHLVESYSGQDLSDSFRREDTNDFYVNIIEKGTEL